MASKVRTIDNKLPRLIRIMQEIGKLASKPHVKIGYPAESEETNKQKENTKEALTVLAVAVHMEFGTKHVDERSFIRSSHDENKQELLSFTQDLVGKIYDGAMTVERALDLIGLKMVNNVKKKIRSKIPPPLATSTIERKKSDVPLIDTGQLLNAVTFKRIMK